MDDEACDRLADESDGASFGCNPNPSNHYPSSIYP